jgi:hypothetical protein
MATPRDVAEWMLGQLKQNDILYQETAVWDIQEKFGDDSVYENENGNMAISRTVLREFRKLTEKTVVWNRRERYWRFREELDENGRRQDY